MAIVRTGARERMAIFPVIKAFNEQATSMEIILTDI
jgi:hypothetical protein